MKQYIPEPKKRLAKLLYECGLCVLDICELCDMSRTTFYRISEGWEKGKNLDYIMALKKVLECGEKMSKEEKYLAENIAECMATRKSLIIDLLVTTCEKVKDRVNKGTKQTLVKLNDNGSDRVEFVTEELSIRDYKDVVDIADKAAMGLGVSERFASVVKEEDSVSIIEPFRDGLRFSKDTSKEVDWTKQHQRGYGKDENND